MLQLQIGWAKNRSQWYILVFYFVPEMKNSPIVNQLNELAQHEVG